MLEAYVPFPKVPRLNREIIITEKIDGTNAQVFIADDGVTMLVGSRTRWITPEQDNHGFARWAEDHRDELLRLGPGRHFGEWWGSGIQRGYGLPKGEKRFSLFNVSRWADDAARPACCHVVPTLHRGPFDQGAISYALQRLGSMGSSAAPGFMKPEGIIVFHTASNSLFKVTVEKDDEPKSAVEWRAKQARAESPSDQAA
ncbi:MAG: RNA ligase family protein [Methylorubrum rhodinum]|uniref:RNA ligase family protein n=1 Tax=Methylorubrum rhodinum TaxID=29428 RepID=UPI003BB0E0A6